MKTALIVAAIAVALALLIAGCLAEVNAEDKWNARNRRDVCQALNAKPVLVGRGYQFICVTPDGRIAGPVLG